MNKKVVLAVGLLLVVGLIVGAFLIGGVGQKAETKVAVPGLMEAVVPDGWVEAGIMQSEDQSAGAFILIKNEGEEVVASLQCLVLPVEGLKGLTLAQLADQSVAPLREKPGVDVTVTASEDGKRVLIVIKSAEQKAVIKAVLGYLPGNEAKIFQLMGSWPVALDEMGAKAFDKVLGSLKAIK